MAMNQHKRMAGADSGGNFGVSGYPGSGGKNHVSPETGEDKGSLMDSARGAKPSAGSYGAYGRQAHPDHGPLPDHFSRGGKV